MTNRKGKPRTPIAERFARLCIPEPNSGCWLWEGSQNEFGYGLIWVNERGGRAERAHRVAVQLDGRSICATDVVRHQCDNPSCVNPAHLVVGTDLENVHDRITRGRSAVGEKASKARLSSEQARFIRASPEPVRALARRFGVHHSTISGIKTRKIWRHI